MIKANELRVGNLVSITGVQIKLGAEKLAFILEQDGDETRCDGIPLTPEILERCGFKRGSEVRDRNVWYSTGAHKHDWQIGISQFGGTNWIMHMQQSLSINNLDYLHQLQNIYFALTGEELEIKELEHA